MDNINTELGFQNYLNDGVIFFDENGMLSSINLVAVDLYRKLGYIDELIEVLFDDLVLDGSRFEDVISSSSPIISEISVGDMILKVKYATMTADDFTFDGLVMIIKDVTAERAIEKELILKSGVICEIHHRVKNNLQTIASLLRLQSRRIENAEIKKAFEESINRVVSIATTHEILAHEGVEQVDIKMILSRIANNLIEISEYGNMIELEISGDSFSVKSDIATSIAIVVNELFQNSIQYAFIGRESGKIQINIKKDIHYSEITVIDDGIGFDMKNTRESSLGMKIVKNIIKDKLNGRYTIESNKEGTKIIFDLKM